MSLLEETARRQQTAEEAVRRYRGNGQNQSGPGRDPLGWISEFTLTDEEANELMAPAWAYENLLIEGHIMALCAPGNAGKTQLMLYVSRCLAAQGYRVLYLNLDANPGDAKRQLEYAKRYGFEMLFPEIKSKASVEKLLKRLQGLAAQDVDLDRVVLVLDTLKKFVNMIHKASLAQFIALLRRLTGRGATVAVAAHTNKYAGQDGKLVFEGTGDLRNDVDELIYLYAEKQADGAVLVSTDPDKVRGAFSRISFRIVRVQPELLVEPIAYIDVAAQARKRDQHEADWDHIQAVLALLKSGAMARTELIRALTKDPHRVPRRAAARVVDRYKREDAIERYWLEESQYMNNEKTYRLNDAR